jgi:surface carbohydrate biosynthesis protein
MANIDVLFFIEHVDRELDAAAAIALVLERDHGLAVDIRNFYSDFLYCLWRYDPAVVVTPFCYFLDHSPMRDYVKAWPQARFFNMAWEQILYTMNKTVKVPKDEFAKARVRHVCWTRQYKGFLRDLGVPESSLVLAGNPVMQFYDPPYRDYFASRAMLAKRHGLDPSRKWVLFPENYRWAFLSESQMKAFVDQDADPRFLAEAKDYCLRSLTRLFEWLGELSRDEDPIVILRPRPATARDEMAGFLAGVVSAPPRNLRIIKSESAREWILAADHVVSSYSTTLIEAALAGKPVHVFSPERFPEALEDEWYGLVPCIETKQALVGALRENGAGQTGARLNAWARERLLPAGDPLPRIAAAVAALRKEAPALVQGAAPPDHGRLIPFQGVVERVRNSLQRRPGYHESLRRRDSRYSFTIKKHEKDIFGAHDVARRLRRWQKIAP